MSIVINFYSGHRNDMLFVFKLAIRNIITKLNWALCVMALSDSHYSHADYYKVIVIIVVYLCSVPSLRLHGVALSSSPLGVLRVDRRVAEKPGHRNANTTHIIIISYWVVKYCHYLFNTNKILQTCTKVAILVKNLVLTKGL